MWDILNRLLSAAEPVRLFCTVVAALPDNRYTVVDEPGRKLTVDGAVGYIPGHQVVIQAGQIVGFGSRPAIKKTIRV